MNTPLVGCENNYSEDELYELYGTNEEELQKCMSCSNSIRVDGGIITCKYFNNKNETD